MGGNAEQELASTEPQLDPFRKRPKTLLSKATNVIAPAIVVRMVRHLQKKPIEEAEEYGAKFGRFVMKIDSKHRNRTISNLKMIFPEWSDEKILKVTQQVFEHFGRIGADFTHIPLRSHEKVLSSSQVEGLEHLHEAMSLGKGVIAITGHFGNWEWLGQWMAANDTELAVVARDANQGPIQDLLQSIRESAGTVVLSRGNAARAILSRLKANKVIGILPDQNSRDIYVPFFGQMCGTVIGPATFHQKLGSPIVPVFAVRKGPEQYQIIFKPMIQPVSGYEAVEGITRAINNSLEEMIRAVPEQWLWMHDRWKSARLTNQLH